MKSIRLYDTTLRDGTQGEKISFTAQDKLKVARKLDDMGIHYIEGGWPGASAKDFDFFQLAAKETFQHARIAAFCATHKHGSTPEDDRQLNVVLESGAPVGTIVGKTWDLHVTKILGIPLEANLEMIENSVAYLKKNGLEVHYDAEHFFDGYKENPEYAARTIRAAVAGGADAICLCDTNGGALPHEIEEITTAIREVIDSCTDRPIHIGIHTHNDSNLAVANSIVAVRAGATIVQGTINGYGERCGNADLTSIIPILQLKMGYACISEENLAKLQKVSLYVSETANMTPVNSRPFVGKSAFTHKGGLHVDAIMKEPRSYEHITPELVGNRRRVLISDMAGKGNIRYKARELGFPVDENGYDYAEIVNTVKRLEQEGYQYDVADGSLRILMEKLTDQFQPCFELESFRVTVEKEKDRPCRSHAMIKINVEGIEEITAAEGHGPVSALDNSLRKALNNVYRNVLDPVHLVDFKVRVLDGRDGTGAKVRVLIESRDEETIWSTIGVSEDIIEASWQALADSFQYKLARITNGNNQSVQEQGK
ncbi:2-isopropylmalate synthase [Desulfosalsimonas propionicica]|uniref:Citramalate synthase n=1 Tax=Desulfosalsimonas propionicica TaxID=332175 RepID=A0A7W0HLL5_9BACT|nr:citramalate synthase [Desulfosalsimonas propionicica]MBA2882469.1 2-isopropylmalate synthase [Desulfosalsimonas propionicica]